MKYVYSIILTAIFVIALFATPTVAQVGVPWDKQFSGANRFNVLGAFGNQAVLDRETGLVWEMAPSTTTFTTSEAHFHCNPALVGNRFGWRVPTIQELASLLDPTHANPALTAGHPFTNIITNDLYWSATPGDPQWSVGFGGNGVVTNGGGGSGDGKNLVWCVRGGQGVDTQP